MESSSGRLIRAVHQLHSSALPPPKWPKPSPVVGGKCEKESRSIFILLEMVLAVTDQVVFDRSECKHMVSSPIPNPTISQLCSHFLKFEALNVHIYNFHASESLNLIVPAKSSEPFQKYEDVFGCCIRPIQLAGIREIHACSSRQTQVKNLDKQIM